MAGSDLNGNGHVDIVVSNASSNTGSVLLGIGNGQLAAPKPDDDATW